MILAIASTKGGVGKSTFTANLGVALNESGKHVFLIDNDKQGTLSDWQSIREKELPPVARAKGIALTEISNSQSKKGFVLIDTAGADSKDTRETLWGVDAVITISAPTNPDLWALRNLQRVLESLGEQKGKPVQWYLVLNRVHPNTKDLDFVSDYLKAANVYPTRVFTSVLRQRTAYSDALGVGLGITEYTDNRACSEFIDLRDELLTILNHG